jgi:hypothetical protein
MSSERKHHSPEEKVAILRRHLIDRVPVSTLCGEVQDEREVKAARNPVPPTLFRRSKSAAESGLSLW